MNFESIVIISITILVIVSPLVLEICEMRYTNRMISKCKRIRGGAKGIRLIDADALSREIQREANPYGKPTIDFETAIKIMEWIDQKATVNAD